MQISRTSKLWLTRPRKLESSNHKFDPVAACRNSWVLDQFCGILAKSARIPIAVALCVLFAVTTSAQTTGTTSSVSQAKALDRTLDRLETHADGRFSLPSGRPFVVNITVNCSLPASPLGSLTAALAVLNPNAVSTIHVSGNCHENVSIQGFENLTIIANSGASIGDASSGQLDVIDVADTREFSLQGFTINGGTIGVACFDNSLCHLSGNTVQGSTGDGVLVSRARADFQGDTFQNNAGRGLAVINGSLALVSGVTVQGNGAAGTIANAGGRIIAVNLTSRNNGGAGIRIGNHSTLRLIDGTVSGNGGSGVRLDGGSEALFDTAATGNTITGNGANGVALFDLSFVSFNGADNITGNNLGNPGGVDVSCGPQFSATRGALTSIGGGTTNCVEP